MQQRFFDWHVENIFQFGSEIASLRMCDPVLGGGHQSTVAGKPDRVERPQALLIESGNLVESIEGTPMRIAGTVRKLLQLAEHRDIGIRTQQLLHLRQGGDTISVQKPAQNVSGKDGGAHNAVIPPLGRSQRKNYIIK